MATIGEIVADLPAGVWHDLPEHGCRLRHYENPVRVEVMPVPVIHVTRAEFDTERFWAERVDPVARAHGIDTNGSYYGLRIDSGNPAQQLLQDDDGRLVLVVHVSVVAPEATGEPFRSVPRGCTCPLNARTCPAHGAASR